MGDIQIGLVIGSTIGAWIATVFRPWVGMVFVLAGNAAFVTIKAFYP